MSKNRNQKRSQKIYSDFCTRVKEYDLRTMKRVKDINIASYIYYSDIVGVFYKGWN